MQQMKIAYVYQLNSDLKPVFPSFFQALGAVWNISKFNFTKSQK